MGNYNGPRDVRARYAQRIIREVVADQKRIPQLATIAAGTGYTRAYMTMVFKGRRRGSVDFYEAVAAYLGCSVGKLIRALRKHIKGSGREVRVTEVEVADGVTRRQVSGRKALRPPKSPRLKLSLRQNAGRSLLSRRGKRLRGSRNHGGAQVERQSRVHAERRERANQSRRRLKGGALRVPKHLRPVGKGALKPAVAALKNLTRLLK